MNRTSIREIHVRDEWNAHVVSLENYDVRQGYEWGEVRQTQGWTPRRVAVFHGDRCLAAASILVRRIPLSGRTLLYAPGGPLVHDSTDTFALSMLMEGISRIAKETGAIFLRVDPKIPHADTRLRTMLRRASFLPLPEDWTIWNIPRIGMVLDVVSAEDELKRRVRKRFREYIASAPARNVSVRIAVSADEMHEFHASLAAVGRRKGLPVRGRAYFERLWQEYVRTGRGVLLMAEHAGVTVGGLLGIRLGRRAEMLYVNVRDPINGVRLHHGPLLYWEFIRWAKAAGCEVVDWGGVGTHFPPKDDDPGLGIYHFKLGFNARLEYLTGYYDLPFAPQAYEAFRSLELSCSALAWTTRAKLNARFSRSVAYLRSGARKSRQLRVSLRQRGLAKTMYWAAFGYLRPNRFVIFSRDLGETVPLPRRDDVTFEIWDAAALRAWRRGRTDLPPEFFQDEIDGVEMCTVALQGREVTGLIWMYSRDDASRLFDLGVLEADLNNGVVLPEHRGRRLFRDIILAACSWLREHGYRRAMAGVHTENGPSLAAFRGAGFGELGSSRHFLLSRPKFAPDRTMVPAIESDQVETV